MTARLSLSATEMNTVPDSGIPPYAASWLLANARGKSRSMPMTSPVERISGPSTESTVWPSFVRKRLKGSTASLTETGESSGTREPSTSRQEPLGLELGDRRARHDARRGLGQRDAERLRDERHRAARARVGLDHVEHARADRELHVDEPLHPDALRDREGRGADAVDLGAPERDRRQRAARVARVDAGLLEVLHHAADVELVAVVERVDVEFDRVVEEAVDQQRHPRADDRLVGDAARSSRARSGCRR